MDSKDAQSDVDEFLVSGQKKNSKVLAQFDALPDAAAVSDAVVAVLCSCNVSTVWDRVKKGTFLQPIRIGGSTRWNVGQLRAFLATGDLPKGCDVAPEKVTAATNRARSPRSEAHQLSMRDQLAAHALNGLLAAGWCEEERILAGSWLAVAVDAYKAADAMLTARGAA